MQDKSKDEALHALRKQIIPNDLDGLVHVEVMLVLRGVDIGVQENEKIIANKIGRGVFTMAFFLQCMSEENP